MAEFIGSRISLISKRDIRYVGTLHEISSENSTVALEQVVSFGTEGRRPEDEVPPSDNVYEYIVFRGSDVKDLRIEETPKENKPPKPQVPDDPAILGSARRSTPSSTAQAPVQQQQQSQDGQPKQSQQPSQPQQSSQFQQNQQQQPHQPQQVQQLNQHQHSLPRFQQHPYQFFYPPPPNPRFGPQGFPPGPGFPGIPYGAPPPGWYPPPGQAFHHPPPGQFYAQQPPIGSVAQQQAAHGPPGPPVPPPQQPVSGAITIKKDPESKSQKETPEKPVATVKLPSASTTPGPASVPLSTPPPPPTGTKPDVAAALAPPAPIGNKENPTSAKPVPTGPKNGRIMPAIPRHSPAIKPPVPVNGKSPASLGNSAPEKAQAPTKPENNRPAQAATTKSLEDANRDAKAAVAAAMAKLPPPPGQKKETNGESAVDNLTRKVNEMRTNDNTRVSRQPGTGGFVTGYRGGRGGYRGGRPQAEQQFKKVEVPATDYDFASANAKFNKQDLVKEAIATGSAIGLSADAGNSNDTSAETSGYGARKGSEPSVIISPIASYNKSSSFFDNISSESKDRDDGGGQKLGGREFRSEEQKKNFETFGQGSVDNGYRGGFRGRGRGRGYGRARGGYARGGRGAMRGGQGAAAGAIHAES